MEVRQATRRDLLEIARVAHHSLWDACDGLLRTATITATLDHEYSPSSLKRRLLAGDLVVALGSAGRMVGFAESGVEDEHISVKIHSAPRAARRAEWVNDLVRAVGARHPGRPVCADVLLGNLPAERSCEVAGFIPGEVLLRTVFGEQVVERRWWNPLAE